MWEAAHQMTRSRPEASATTDGPTTPVDIHIVNWNGEYFVRHLVSLAVEITTPQHRF